MTDLSASRTHRVDFRATSDPTLHSGEITFFDYRGLYELWERQQWAARSRCRRSSGA